MPHAPSSCPAHRDPQLQPKRKPKRKPPPNRRIQVTDSEGWTKVTNTTQARRAFSSPSSTRTSTSNANDEIRSSEPPHNLTLPTLRKQFEACRAKWLESETWRVMEGVLRRGISASVSASWSGSSPGFGSGSTAGIHQIISIGLGSPSGFLAGGWVDRRIVSLYQLAGLVSIRDLYGTLPPSLLIWSASQIYHPDSGE